MQKGLTRSYKKISGQVQLDGTNLRSTMSPSSFLPCPFSGMMQAEGLRLSDWRPRGSFKTSHKRDEPPHHLDSLNLNLHFLRKFS